MQRLRSLPALISLLAFPCIYWLCLELFQSSLVGWVAVALIAVSPFHVLYAQEARQYSLWSVTTLLSSATLLWAMRLKTKLSWGMYAATVALGLYTFLFSGLVTIAHGIYVVASESFRLSKRVIAYLLASLVGLLAFTPWLFVIITNLTQLNGTTNWTTEKKPWSLLMQQWAINLSYLFGDFDYDFVRPFDGSLLKYMTRCLILVSLILVGYSIYFLCRQAPTNVWLFILTLIGATALPLAIPDLISGGVRSHSPRYLIPAYLGIQLAVAYLLATQITRKLWQLVTVALVSVGILSCAISSQAETWWLKYHNVHTPGVVRIINQASHPLVISSCHNGSLGDVTPLSYLLAPKVRLQLLNESNVPQIPNSFSDVFLYDYDHNPILQGLRSKLEKEQKYKIKNVYPDMYHLKKLAK